MKKLTLIASALLAVTAFASTGAKADIYNDPLQFNCSGCGIDNGTFTPINGTTPTGIQVLATGNGGLSGVTDFVLKVLIPNTFTPTGENVGGTVNGLSFSGTTNLLTGVGGAAQFTTGFLESTFLGITNFGNGAPPNPIGAFLPSTQALDPGATGFFVLALDLAQITAVGQHFADSPFLLNFLQALPTGSWILGDACQGGTVAARTCVDTTTAQSTALFVNQVSAVPLPASWQLFLGALVLLGGFYFVRSRRHRGPVSLLGAATA